MIRTQNIAGNQRVPGGLSEAGADGTPSKNNAGQCPRHNRHCPQYRELVDGALQSLAGLELGLIRRGYLNSFARPWIASLCSGAPDHTEGTKANQADGVTPLQGTCDGIDDSVNRARGVGLCHPRTARNGCNKIILIQFEVPSSKVKFTLVRELMKVP